MEPCESGPCNENVCEQYEQIRRECSNEYPLQGPSSDSEQDPRPKPVTCPHEKSLLYSMRVQGIMMQQMKEEIERNRKVVKVFLGPKRRQSEEPQSGNVNFIEEMMCELKDDLENVKCEFQKIQERERY